MATKENQFDAKDPSLGYFYQVLYALFILLEDRSDRSCVTIESLDDIVVVSNDTTGLYQLKHHQDSSSAMSDRSTDFWKTIRIWAESIASGIISLESSYFVLVTTTNISKKSILYQFTLEQGKRNYSEIKRTLTDIALSTASEANKNGYDAYLSLNLDQQENFLQRIQIIDNSIDIEGLVKNIIRHIQFVAPVGQFEIVYEQISGWWVSKSLQILTNKISSVSYIELKHKLDSIRDTLTMDNLPDDFPDILDIEDLSAFENHTFIKQLRLINCRSNGLRSAISDFRRAFEQRSKWIRQDNCTIEELKYYDQQLYDYWYRVYSLLQDETEGFNNEQLSKAGYDFYKKYFVETDIPIRVREKFNAQYMSKGSCHLMSDEKRIGWHPNYNNLLE